MVKFKSTYMNTTRQWHVWRKKDEYFIVAPGEQCETEEDWELIDMADHPLLGELSAVANMLDTATQAAQYR